MTSFNEPRRLEARHDELWRTDKRAPATSEAGVFTRSPYEPVLAGRVHGLAQPDVWTRRYEEINTFERVLIASTTNILKFFLDGSQEEHLEPLQGRLSGGEQWRKLAAAGGQHRACWDDDQATFDVELLSTTSTESARWYGLSTDKIGIATLQSRGFVARAPRPKAMSSALLGRAAERARARMTVGASRAGGAPRSPDETQTAPDEVDWLWRRRRSTMCVSRVK
jgi:polyphosphate kinase 2 (PPK2 family)